MTVPTLIHNANPDLFVVDLPDNRDEPIFSPIIAWRIEPNSGRRWGGGPYSAAPITPARSYSASDECTIMNRKYGDWHDVGFTSGGKGEKALVRHLRFWEAERIALREELAARDAAMAADAIATQETRP